MAPREACIEQLGAEAAEKAPEMSFAEAGAGGVI